MAATPNLKSTQVDFTNAFCQADQVNEVFIELPQHCQVEGREDEDLVLRLNKSLCGQKDALKHFHNHIAKGLHDNGFEPAKQDPRLFIHDDMVAILCAGDVILIGKEQPKINAALAKPHKDGCLLEEEEADNDVCKFLGIKISHEKGNVVTCQGGLIKKFLDHVGMNKCSPSNTPANCVPVGSDKNGEPFQETWSCAMAVEQLLHLSSNGRPDIQFAVHQTVRFIHNPKKSHGVAIKRVARHLQGTSKEGLILSPDASKGLDCWVDADFAGLWGHEDEQDPVCAKSQTGHVITLFGCLLIWSSKPQIKICLGSTASKIMAFTSAVRELIPL